MEHCVDADSGHGLKELRCRQEDWIVEHRYSHRERIELDVWVGTPDGTTRKGRLRDFNEHGARLSLMEGTPPANNVVEVIFPGSNGARAQRNPRKARGFVVRTMGSEIGLLWIETYDWQRFIPRNSGATRHDHSRSAITLHCLAINARRSP